MALRSLLLFSCLLVVSNLGAQSFHAGGRVLEKAGRRPVAYANVYNKTLCKGTISNGDGYFTIPVSGGGDTVFISFVGYKKQMICPAIKDAFHTVLLEAEPLLLKEVLIAAPDDTWLRNLLVECRKRAPEADAGARAYFELKSYVEDEQVELVESFYNVITSGYDLASVQLKAGRLAVKPFRNGLFVSMSGSRAITLLKLFDRNQYFPQSPLEMTAQKIKKHYYLELIRKFRDDNQDSVYEIRFNPHDTSGLFFSGTVWLNPLSRQLYRINLVCPHSRKYPFLPVFNTDQISNVDFNISRTFRSSGGRPLFDHTDFKYNIDYISRKGSPDEMSYRVATGAVFVAFDYEKLFSIPLFAFKDDNIDDYKKISALPYNEFFWRNNSDNRLCDHQRLNEEFFNDTANLTSAHLFTQQRIFKSGLYETPFMQWSASRVILRKSAPGLSGRENGGLNFAADQYNLAVKIFLDINSGSDSTHILTATVLDPMDSYYLLPMDSVTHCFINIWFDLVEAERRKFEKQIALSDKKEETVRQLYNGLLAGIETLKLQFMKEMERGTNLQALRKWNDVIVNELGINNMVFFHLDRGRE